MLGFNGMHHAGSISLHSSLFLPSIYLSISTHVSSIYSAPVKCQFLFKVLEIEQETRSTVVSALMGLTFYLQAELENTYKVA